MDLNIWLIVLVLYLTIGLVFDYILMIYSLKTAYAPWYFWPLILVLWGVFFILDTYSVISITNITKD